MEATDYGSPATHTAHTVEDEAQARLLSAPKSFGYFRPFLARTCTVSRAAEEVGCRLDTMMYRVRTFMKAGLLTVVRVEKRAGRPVKHYRSSHDAYFVPFSAKPFADIEEEVRKGLRSHEDAIVKGLARTKRTLDRQGHRVSRLPNGEVRVHSAGIEHFLIDYDALPRLPYSPGHEGLSLAELFTDELFLTDDEAKALLSRLYALWRENKLEASETRKPYLLRVALVPL